MLSGKVALITGSAGDLGNAMAVHLARAGASVVMWDIQSEAAAANQIERVRAEGQSVTYHRVDVADRAAVDSAMDAIPRLDIICSNAGIVDAVPFLEVSQENWQKHMDVNLTGCFNVGQSGARKMVAAKTQGRIILTSSWVGSIP
jgi:NAD(P)-dependent dehydrogenase (short-subunit alcohol dehydrogenase family)